MRCFLWFVFCVLVASAADGGDVKIDYAKMRVKELRQVLADRGVACEGCSEKSHFVEECQRSETKTAEAEEAKEGQRGTSMGGDTSGAAAAAADAAKAEALKNAGGDGAGAKVDYAKMRVKQLRKVLAARGVGCKGCDEKAQFVAKAEATKDLPGTAQAAAVGDKATDAQKKKKKQKNSTKDEEAALAKAAKAKAAADKAAYYGGLEDAKELKEHKWRLKAELKAVEARIKELKNADKGGKGKEEGGPPKCVKECLRSYDDCVYKNTAKGAQPLLEDSCRCHRKLYASSCNTCDAAENSKLVSICKQMGCAAVDCELAENDAAGAAGAETPKKAKKKKSPRRERRAEADWLKSPAELLDPLFDPAKLRAKQLRRILDDVGPALAGPDGGCVGCSEKKDFVAAVRAAIDKLAAEKEKELKESGGGGGGSGGSGAGGAMGDDGMDDILRTLKEQGVDAFNANDFNMPDLGASGHPDFGASGGGDKKKKKKNKHKNKSGTKKSNKAAAAAADDEEWDAGPATGGGGDGAVVDDNDETGASDPPDPAFEMDTKAEASEKAAKKAAGAEARAKRKEKNKQEEKASKEERKRAKEAEKEEAAFGDIEEVIELDDEDEDE